MKIESLKKTHASIITSLLLGVVLMGLVMMNVRADTEPNDDFASAELITPGNYVGSVNSVDINDYYKLELAAAGQTVYANVTVDATIEIGLYLYDQSKDEKYTHCVVTDGVAMVSWCFQTAQKVYIRIEKTGGTGTYDMEIAVTSQNDANSGGDAGNVFADATPVAPGTYTDGFLKDEDFEDYYTLNLAAAGQTVYANVTVDAAIEISLYLYDQSKDEKYTHCLVTDGVASVEWYFETAQTIYIRIVLNGGSGFYDMRVAPSEFIDATVPSAPQNLQASPGDQEVSLSWTAPSSDGDSAITNYAIYKGKTSGGETLLTTIGNVLAYTDTGLNNDQIYYYKVSAVNGVGESEKSNEASATPTGNSVPDAPTSLTPIGGDQQVILNWEAPPSDGGSPITNYRIYQGASSGGETLLTTIGNVVEYTVTGLTNDQIYYYMVSAVNGIGEGAKSNEASTIPTGLQVPGAPINLTVIRGDHQIILYWEAPLNEGDFIISNYKIYRGTAIGEETYLTTVGEVLTYIDTNLTNNVTYYYKVSAINSIGEGAQSNETVATPVKSTKELEAKPLILYVSMIVIIAVIIGIALLLVGMRKRRVSEGGTKIIAGEVHIGDTRIDDHSTKVDDRSIKVDDHSTKVDNRSIKVDNRLINVDDHSTKVDDHSTKVNDSVIQKSTIGK